MKWMSKEDWRVYLKVNAIMFTVYIIGAVILYNICSDFWFIKITTVILSGIVLILGCFLISKWGVFDNPEEDKPEEDKSEEDKSEEDKSEEAGYDIPNKKT